jgi:hypothetical protein
LDGERVRAGQGRNYQSFHIRSLAGERRRTDRTRENENRMEETLFELPPRATKTDEVENDSAVSDLYSEMTLTAFSPGGLRGRVDQPGSWIDVDITTWTAHAANNSIRLPVDFCDARATGHEKKI